MILDSAVQIAAKEHRAAKPQPICYQPQKNAQIAKKTGWETKRLYGRGMNGRGMNSHTSLGLIPLPFIPLPNIFGLCDLCTAMRRNHCPLRKFSGARLGLEDPRRPGNPNGNGRGMIGKGMEPLWFSRLHSSAVHSPAFISGTVGLRLRRDVFSRGHPKPFLR
jgi:hypothetical protein